MARRRRPTRRSRLRPSTFTIGNHLRDHHPAPRKVRSPARRQVGGFLVFWFFGFSPLPSPATAWDFHMLTGYRCQTVQIIRAHRRSEKQAGRTRPLRRHPHNPFTHHRHFRNHRRLDDGLATGEPAATHRHGLTPLRGDLQAGHDLARVTPVLAPGVSSSNNSNNSNSKKSLAVRLSASLAGHEVAATVDHRSHRKQVDLAPVV